MYQCSRCGATMSQPLDRCPKCGVLLSGVRCEACKYIGGKTEFINNNHRCPKCNSTVHIPGLAYTSAPKPAPKMEPCKRCGIPIQQSDWTCPHCGYTQWNMIIGMGVMTIVLLAVAYFTSDCIRWGAGVAGAVLLLTVASSIYSAIKINL